MRKISGDFDRDPINMRWAPDGSGVYFDADDRGARNIQFAAIVGGVKPLTTGRHMLTFDSVSKDGIAAGIAADLDHPQDVVKFSVRQPGPVTRLTDVNGDVLQGIQLAKVEEITYSSTGNAKVMGWVVKPPSFDASKKYPLILEIHGGPFGNYNVALQLHVPELRRQRLRRAGDQPARQHRLRQRVHQRHRSQLSRPRLRRSDGRRRHRRRQGLRRHVADVRVRLQRRRRAFELGDRPHRSLRRGRGALSGDRLDEHGGAHRRPALHVQLLQEAVLGGSVRLAVALVADDASAR